MAYGYFKDLTRITACDKILHDKALNIAKNLNYDGYERVLALIVYKCFDKKFTLLARSKTLATRDKSVSSSVIKNENISNEDLSEKLHKPIIRKFKKKNRTLIFTDNTWSADLACMQLIHIFNK